MKKKDNQVLNFPPFWAGIIGSIICAVIVLFLLLTGSQSKYPRIDNRLFLALICCAFIYSCTYYSASKDCLTLRLFGIPLRKIPWSKVSGATYLCNLKTRRGADLLHCVILSLHPAQQFAGQSSDELKLFKQKNRFKYVQLNIPEGKDTEFLEALEQYLEVPISS